MNTNSLYFIAVLPPKSIQDQVTNIKKEFAEKYNSSHALKSPPHITLIPPFNASLENEKKVVELLHGCVINRHEFEVKVNDFGSFKPRVIFVHIEENGQLKSLAEDIFRKLRELTEIQIKQGKSFNPHMSVAFRDLKPPMFHQAWDKYKSASFNASFYVKSVFLLKHNGKFWDIRKEIKFTAELSPT